MGPILRSLPLCCLLLLAGDSKPQPFRRDPATPMAPRSLPRRPGQRPRRRPAHAPHPRRDSNSEEEILHMTSSASDHDTNEVSPRLYKPTWRKKPQREGG
ncbi:hypothetical protein M6B38_334850 [Iris pallida]|uniref:Uncharacterized protein n=1 Tax=Iris pallida TaxID=29817 RepID=A0AAX6H0L7_IRIPA|nr:hypothetical protein M6B38_334850 [Iris pallida]